MKWWTSRSARRGFASLALALGLLLPVLPASAGSSVRVTVETPHLGNGALASRMRSMLPRLIAAEMAVAGSEIVPAGGRLVIRIREIFLASGEVAEDFGGLSMGDAIDGEALVLDAQGRLVARRPVAARSPVSAGGFGPVMQTEARRIDALMETLAYWVARGR